MKARAEAKALRPLQGLSRYEGIRTRPKMRSVQIKRMVPGWGDCISQRAQSVWQSLASLFLGPNMNVADRDEAFSSLTTAPHTYRFFPTYSKSPCALMVSFTLGFFCFAPGRILLFPLTLLYPFPSLMTSK